MKDRPINFNSEMVLALLERRKTMTRRIADIPLDSKGGECKPKFHVGDRLWVREAYYQFGHWEPVPGKLTRTGKQKWKFVPDSENIRYEPRGPFDIVGNYRKGMHKEDQATPAWHKRLARFMPRKYARIWLEITDVRVERVQEISEEDAKAEGVRAMALADLQCIPSNEMHKVIQLHRPTYRVGFIAIWDSIYAERGYGWDANPWVWVVSFKVISTKGNQ